MTSLDPIKCSECGEAIPSYSQDGFCARCLLGFALQARASESTPIDAKPGFDLPENGARCCGNHQILEEIARGGMGAATGASLTLGQTGPENAGAYSLEVKNGIDSLTSATAILQVNADPSCARIAVPPSDTSVTPRQTANFEVGVRGYPFPSIQWFFEGVPIAGATNATFSLFHANCDSSGAYSVTVTNPLCSDSATARLSVTRRPLLRITEVMPSVSFEAALLGFSEWWELTNFDDYPFNLRGYRWDDSPSVLKGAFTITEDVVVQPGESIIFAQRMTREEFIEWWGPENLPENLQVIRYTGNSLSAGDDSIRLWNATATDRDDYIDSLGFVHLNEDFTSIRGVTRTFWCDGPLEFGQPSVLGECGAFQAARSEDIGSPGYTSRFSSRGSSPRFLRISRDADGVHLTFETERDQHYELQYKNSLSDPDWNVLSGQLGTGARLSLSDGLAPGANDVWYNALPRNAGQRRAAYYAPMAGGAHNCEGMAPGGAFNFTGQFQSSLSGGCLYCELAVKRYSARSSPSIPGGEERINENGDLFFACSRRRCPDGGIDGRISSGRGRELPAEGPLC